MQLKLNIYKGGQVEKTYEAGEFDIMFGTVEDLIDLLDMDKLGKDTSDMEFVTAIVRVVSGGKDKLKEILKEIFPELTDEECEDQGACTSCERYCEILHRRAFFCDRR